MPYDPTKPANNAPLSSAEMRSQLTGLQSLVNDAVNGSSANSNGVAFFGTDITDPPSQEQMQDLANTVNALIAALRR